MNITPEQVDLLKKHGFQWYKKQSTDTVHAGGIKDILPIDGGFAVLYNETAVIAISCAKISEIDLPEDLENQWIRVHWDKIEDSYFPGRKPAHVID